ncbi:VOC family protein [Pusillimonas sp. SM2304]|uniref:VOC family protein n=1 Tax=Pusillimonas sp. SM2304 TaxID=3073241 RepID=UPI00287667CB|nr:VOC family protein [Pusillimonas sp. SM2304]MDS1140260.1 VOC family protein [Pusillimonas sp. SM2304]
MIHYTMLGTNNLARSIRFYDPLFQEMGMTVRWRDEQITSWGLPGDASQPLFFVGYPRDKKAASVGNGSMIAFRVEDPAKIDRLYALALELGGADEGPAGPRPEYGEAQYAAYVRDPDGNKIAFVNYRF